MEQVENRDRLCILSIDEMSINSQLAFDKNRKELIGHVTIDDESKEIGKKMLVAIIRGIKSN